MVLDAERTKKIVKKSYEVTGMFPYVSSTELVTPNAADSVAVRVYKATLAATTRLALPLLTMAKVAEEKAALALLEEQVVTVEGEEMVRVVTVTSRLVKKSQRSSEGVGVTSVTKFAVSEYAAIVAEKSYVTPANEVATKLAAHALAKKTKVDKQANVLSTAGGLWVTQDVVLMAKARADADKVAAELKRKNRDDGKAKKEEARKKNVLALKRVTAMAAKKQD
jgi:hypothetical protein